MKTVIVISPDYLSSVYKEVKKYSFVMQGYGSFRSACSGILKVNCGDLIGVAFVSYGLPYVGSGEYQSMLEFMQLLNDMDSPRRMVFIVQTAAQSLRQIASKFDNIAIFGVDGEVEITDSLINRKLFGTLLLGDRKPYDMGDTVHEEPKSDLQEDWQLHLNHVVNPDWCLCVSPVTKFDSLQLTLENDAPCEKFRAMDNRLLYLLRRYKIMEMYGYQDNAALTTISNHLEEITDDAEWAVLYSILKGGALC